MSIEIEKKYRLNSDLWAQFMKTLSEIGADPLGEEFEENFIFSNDHLFETNAVVRLRKTGSNITLTFKKRIASNSTAKHQIEFETTVGDGEAAAAILEGIGLRISIIYEKKRTTFRFRNAEIVMDELPFGLFMEIEGQLTAIAEAEMFLGIENLQIERNTYPALTRQLGVRNGQLVEARFAIS